MGSSSKRSESYLKLLIPKSPKYAILVLVHYNDLTNNSDLEKQFGIAGDYKNQDYSGLYQPCFYANISKPNVISHKQLTLQQFRHTVFLLENYLPNWQSTKFQSSTVFAFAQLFYPLLSTAQLFV